MSPDLQWQEIAIRLVLTVIAGSLIGINRSEGGHSAGLRTTLLVGLAASVAMIQTNLLLSMRGRGPESFVMLDLMRLPLGILTGMGFIGGGAILRKGSLVHGVTTAATLWLVTVIGLCLGGGQLGLGAAATALALLILSTMKWVEANMSQVRRASLDVVIEDGGPDDDELRAILVDARFVINSWCIETKRRSGHLHRTIRCELRWKSRPDDRLTPAIINEMTRRPDVKALRWTLND